MSNCETDDIIKEYEENDSSESSDREEDNNLQFSDDENKDKHDKTDKDKNDDDDKDDKKKNDKPKRTRKMVVLNAARLKDKNKGLHKLEGYFEGFKFMGKGHEKQDLNQIMKRIEHWSHRMFPKYAFDDCLEKIEQIGLKRKVNTFVEKYRKDMLTNDDLIRNDDEINDEEHAIELETMPDIIDDISREHTEVRRQISESLFEDQPVPVSAPESAPVSKLSDEMKEMIERKRLEAIEKRKKKQEQKSEFLSENLDSFEDINFDFTVPVASKETLPPVNVVLTLQEQIEIKRQKAIALKQARQKEKEEQAKASNLGSQQIDASQHLNASLQDENLINLTGDNDNSSNIQMNEESRKINENIGVQHLEDDREKEGRGAKEAEKQDLELSEENMQIQEENEQAMELTTEEANDNVDEMDI